VNSVLPGNGPRPLPPGPGQEVPGAVHEVHEHVAGALGDVGVGVVVAAFAEAPPDDERTAPQVVHGEEAPVAAVGAVVAVVAHGEDVVLGDGDRAESVAVARAQGLLALLVHGQHVGVGVAPQFGGRRIVVDAGFKAMSSQHSLPEPLGIGAVRSLGLSAEHGRIELEQPAETPSVGDKLELVVGYTDSTVFLHDVLYGVRDGCVEVAWPILGRGKVW